MRILLLTFCLLGVGAAQAESPQGHLNKPKITRAQARKTALAKHPGKIKSAELETENNRLIYSFDIQTKEGIYEVGVDANDGSIVEDKQESAAAEAKEKAADMAKKKAKARKKD